ncbi:MAG: hypothetical protein ACYSX0_08295 [Planctomycetota bacterium]
MRKALSLSFLLALALMVGVGCAKKKTTVEEAPPEPAAEATADEGAEPAAEPEEGAIDTPAADEPMADEPMEEEPPAEEPPAPEPPAEEPAEVEAPMEPLEFPEGAVADKEQTRVLIQRFRTLAEQKYRQGNLEEAADLYKRILLLDRADADAVKAYETIRREMGERVPVAEDIIDTEDARVKARRQSMIVELNDRLAKARVAEDAGDYDVAISYYQQILNLLNWYKYQADFPVTTEQAKALLERAEKQQSLAAARRQADEINRIAENEQARQERQREEEMRRMGVFLKLASDAYDRGEYDLAQANATKVLALDPRNEAAKQLIRIAKETKYIADRNEIREQFSDEWRTMMERVEYDALPHPEVLNYPKNWSEISKRKPKTTGSQESFSPDPRADQILNTLSQKRVYDLRFEAGDITLGGAIEYLRSVTGLNFVLSQKVKEEKADTEIDLSLDNVSVKQVLDLITEPNEMAWKVRNGVVMILDQEEALDKPVLQFYDVKDLVAKISDFPGQEINLVPSKYQPPDMDDEELEPTSPFEVDSLIEVIRQTIEPESWDTIEGANIEPKNNVLVVTTTPEIHQKIGSFLTDLRKNTGLLISLEVRFLRAEDRFLRDVGVDIRGLGDQTGGVGLPGLGSATNFDDSFFGSPANPSGAPPGIIPEPSSIGTSNIPGVYYNDNSDGEYKARVENLFDFILNFDEPGDATASAAASGGNRGDNSGGLTLQHVFLDDTQLEVILRAVEKSDRLEQVSAPRLTVYDTQRANVSVMKQNSYVSDFDVEIAQAAAIGDPIVQTIRDGIILDVRPIVSADRRFITMELRPTVAELVRPIPTFQTSLATGPPVTIQVPELSISRVRTTVTMPDGGTLLLGGIKFFRDAVAESGIPILSKIPILSFLVSRKAKIIQRRNLLILIRADVLVPEEHAPNLGVG